MSATSHALDSRYAEYLVRFATEEEPGVLSELREATRPLEMARMQISPEQGALMQWLVAALGVRSAIEVGVFTGYSALCTALALPEDGRLVALDVSEEWTNIAREYWTRAGVAQRIELRLGAAEESLRAMLAEGAAGSFDFAFVDADKEGYEAYYELCLELLRPGGVLAFDNAFMGGRVLENEPADAGAKIVKRLNERVRTDERVQASFLPIGDGLLLARKR